VHAWVRDGRIVQLAVLDGALTPDAARDLVQRGAAVDELTL
jgi:hypothetical protein